MIRIAALVPMRHHSQRVPEKNFRDLGGKPLYHYILSTLTQVSEIEGIYVDTDSPLIKTGLGRDFPDIQVIDRPEHLTGDGTSMNRIIAHDLSIVEADYYLQTHSTNPLLRADTISRAINTFLENKNKYDSLFSVTRLQTRLYDINGKAVNHNPEELIQTQDLPPLLEENSCLYLFSAQSLEKQGHRIGSSPYLFEIDKEEAWDIDTNLDFEIVDYLMKNTGE
ncbi:MAG: acylneuraminate cytidylyltransferase family protein [Anaerolineales bacterium]|nr:acylneuraminate cytidylyltransferase family protein [Anaerolineales bacterium]